jgi:creatinine amidohydrolase
MIRAGICAPAMMSATMFGSSRNESEIVKPQRFEEVAGYEIDEVVAQCPLAILPLGSLEYHGPHNPLGADALIISGIAEKVAARTNALLLPTITFTLCPSHTAHFRGTMSVRPEVMTMYFEDILRSTLQLGFKRVFVLNGHDGNIGPGRGAISQVAHDLPETQILFASWWEFVPSEVMKKAGMFSQSNGGHGHGGPLETSAVAAFRPDLIDLNRAHDLPEPPDMSGGPPYFLQKSMAKDWPGYSGKVSEASSVKGREIVRISEDGIVKLIGNWLRSGDAPGSW